MAESTTDQDRAIEDESAVVLDKGTDERAEDGTGRDGEASASEPKPAKRGRRARRAAARRNAGDGATATDIADKTGVAVAEAEESAKAKKRRTRLGAKADGAAAGVSGATGPGGARVLSRVVSGLLVAAIVLAAVLVVQLVKGPGNGPKLVAQEDRSQDALQQANTLIPKLYSYDYRQINANVDEQLQLTTGTINDQIRNQTGPALKQLAPKVKAVVQAVSLDSAVIDDSKPDIQVLVYLNQAVNSSLLPAPRLDRNRVVATMRLVDGQWKVADIKAL